MKRIYLILITALLFTCSSDDDAFRDPIIGRWSAGDDGVCNPSAIITFLQNNNFEHVGSDYIDGECIERVGVYEYSTWQNKTGGVYNHTYKKTGESEVTYDFNTVITGSVLEIINNEGESFVFTKI